MRTDQERFDWLAGLECNSYTLGKNENHAPNYQTAQQWIEDNPKEYAAPYVSDETRQRMIDTNTIWQLQVYVRTPVGFSLCYGATLREVIDDMMDHLGVPHA